MLAAEFFLIPVLPSPLDLWASLRIEEELTRVREEGNASLKAALVLNQVEPRTKLSSQVADVLKQLSIPNLETQIRRRVVFRNAILDGRSVFEAGKKGQDAAAEISAVLKEIL
jgi:chromosome partitioning protein